MKIRNTKYEIRKFKIWNFIFSICFGFLISSFVLADKVFAQSAISLSVSPPIFEAIIQPGKSVTMLFNITNSGGDTIITPQIYYFQAQGEDGNIELTGQKSPDWVGYADQPFRLNGKESLNFEVVITPPLNIEESDHFMTLIFETSTASDLLGQSASFYKSQIGSNILLTISKDGNPKMSAKILKFSAPKIIDSLFGTIEYKLIIENDGNSFWKPNGKIVNQFDDIDLAPQNILSGTSRQIPCISDEKIIDCKIGLKKIFLGRINSKLTFKIDESQREYESKVSTFAFPFSLLPLVILFFLTRRYKKAIFRLWRKIKT